MRFGLTLFILISLSSCGGAGSGTTGEPDETQLVVLQLLDVMKGRPFDASIA